MGFYEHTLVTKQDLSTSEIDGVENKYTNLIKDSKGKLIKVEKWGLLNFARKIKNYKKGFFIHYKFEGNNETLTQIKKNTLIDSSILRHLTVKYKKLNLEKEYFKERTNEKK
tara:strand:- start:106 stop:441 length:336 start_codon:yes stop_codon:yes gene_type:complete